MSELTTEGLDYLEAMAHRASRGKWIASVNEDGWYAVRCDGQSICISGDMEEIDGEDIDNAEYIVAAQPAVTLAMVSEIRFLHECIVEIDKLAGVCADLLRAALPFREQMDVSDELMEKAVQVVLQWPALQARIAEHNAKPERSTAEGAAGEGE